MMLIWFVGQRIARTLICVFSSSWLEPSAALHMRMHRNPSSSSGLNLMRREPPEAQQFLLFFGAAGPLHVPDCRPVHLVTRASRQAGKS